MKKKKASALFCAIVFLFCAFGFSGFFVGSARAEAAMDNRLVKTYQSSSRIQNEPTVVCDVTDKATLEKLTAQDERPSNAILRFDKNADIKGAKGEVLGSFAEVFASLNKTIIPVLCLADEDAADAAIKFLKEEIEILDLAVMSEDPLLVKKVKEQNGKIRGIVSYPAGRELYDIVRTTNKNYANVAVIPQSMATQENVRYIHARFKTVWVRADGSEKKDLYDCVGSGAYGIISSDFHAVYNVLNEYWKGLSRMPFNVAHRGLPNECNENSVSGIEAAAKHGATHVELDGYLTTDGEIVLMHDDSIDRTTTGSGKVESMSLAEIRRYKLSQFKPEEEIPTLDDAIRTLKQTDVVLILEIKSSKKEIVDILKRKLEEYDFWRQTVVISFNPSILSKMKDSLPEVPTANLNAASASSFVSVLNWMGAYNTGIDTPSTSDISFNEATLRDRGIVGWYWTYSDFAGINGAAARGFVGVTNNDASSYENMPMYVSAPEFCAAALTEEAELPVVVTEYSGQKREETGIVFSFEDRGKYYSAVAAYKNKSMTHYLYTQTFKVYKEGAVSPIRLNERIDALSSRLDKNSGGEIEELKRLLSLLTDEDQSSLGTDEKLALLEQKFTELQENEGRGCKSSLPMSLSVLPALLLFCKKKRP